MAKVKRVKQVKEVTARWSGDTEFAGGWSETVVIDGVKFHPHPNGGGLVAETAKVAKTAFVGVFAQVYGDAQVYGNARVYGTAQVYGDAWVYGIHVGR